MVRLPIHKKVYLPFTKVSVTQYTRIIYKDNAKYLTLKQQHSSHSFWTWLGFPDPFLWWNWQKVWQWH